MKNSEIISLKKNFLALRKLGPNYLNNDLKNYFHVEFISVASKLEGTMLEKSDVEKLVKNFPKKPASPAKRGEPKSSNPFLIQAYGQKAALEEIEKFANSKKIISINLLPYLHQLIFGSTMPSAGRLRDHHVSLQNRNFMVPMPFMITSVLKEFDSWLKDQQEKIDPGNVDEIIGFFAEAFYKTVETHPFSDGNGRTARIFCNAILRKYNLPLVIIPKTSLNSQMSESLLYANQRDLRPIKTFFSALLFSSIEMVVAYHNKKNNWKDLLPNPITAASNKGYYPITKAS